jgi:dihydrofolate synthase / folylpolyglutamate synthase
MSQQMPAASSVILHRAKELGCSVFETADLGIDSVEADPYGSHWILENEQFHFPLPGRHQIENGKTALLACRQFGIPSPAIARGLSSTVWPGRIEFMSHGPDLILDGAHNPAGARALAAYIQEFWQNRPVWMVYGAMRDKAIDEVTEILFPLAKRLIVTAADSPRALRPEAILEVRGHTDWLVAPTIAEAIEHAHSAPPDTAVFFTGSLFVIGEARHLLSMQQT